MWNRFLTDRASSTLTQAAMERWLLSFSLSNASSFPVCYFQVLIQFQEEKNKTHTFSLHTAPTTTSKRNVTKLNTHHTFFRNFWVLMSLFHCAHQTSSSLRFFTDDAWPSNWSKDSQILCSLFPLHYSFETKSKQFPLNQLWIERYMFATSWGKMNHLFSPASLCVTRHMHNIVSE